MSALKGNALVGQSGGCTAVINCSLQGVIEAANKTDAIESLFGAWNGIAGVLDEKWTNLSNQDATIVQQLYNTPSAALGSCRLKLDDSQLKKLISIFEKHNIRYLFLIGGNDSADTTLKIHEQAEKSGYEMRVISIPKTIDNDLPAMDHSPGYGSVARYVAETTQEAARDTEAMKLTDPFKVIELMGRNAGWIVGASGYYKQSADDAPHLIYFPENAFDEAQFIKDAKAVYDRLGWCVIVISETIRNKEGNPVGGRRTDGKTDSFGHPLIDGAAEALCEMLEKEFNVRARFDKPGTLQRMSQGYISNVDQEEAKSLGESAVLLATEGKSGVMVIINRVSNDPYQVDYSHVDIATIANQEKKMPSEFIDGSGFGVTDAFRDYLKPLLGESNVAFARLEDL